MEMKEGSYNIPFTIRNNSNNSWNFNLIANLLPQTATQNKLIKNYPNPFNSKTQIQYQLADNFDQKTQILIFNVFGKKIRTLVDKKQSAGFYSISWNGKDDNGQQVSTGIYFYKLTSGTFSEVNKMMFLK